MKVKMIKRTYHGSQTIICKCGEVIHKGLGDTFSLDMPYCGGCGMVIEDCSHKFCGWCGKEIDWNYDSAGHLTNP